MNGTSTAVRSGHPILGPGRVADYPQPTCPNCKGTSFYGQPIGLQVPASVDGGRRADDHDIVLVSCATCGTVVGSYRLQAAFGGMT